MIMAMVNTDDSDDQPSIFVGILFSDKPVGQPFLVVNMVSLDQQINLFFSILLVISGKNSMKCG